MSKKTDSEKAAIFIPARLGSTRLPGKLLLRETGKSVIQHTYESAATSSISPVTVVADGPELVEEVSSFGGSVILPTNYNFTCGTDRVAHAAMTVGFGDNDIIVNVQADHPDVPGKSIDELVEMMRETGDSIATLAVSIESESEYDSRSCVKVLTDKRGIAMHFTRSTGDSIDVNRRCTGRERYMRHIGVYAYRFSELRTIRLLQPTDREAIEGLEQLRFMHHGRKIRVLEIDCDVTSIDTREDYDKFVAKVTMAESP